MSCDHPPPTTTGPRPHRGRFARELVEMLLAMVLGMLLLGGALRVALSAADVAYSMGTFPTLTLLEMALTMTVGTAAVMAARRHPQREIVEMGAAMVLPALLVVPAVRAGALGAGTAMVLEHVAMIAAMVLVMLRHRRLRRLRPGHVPPGRPGHPARRHRGRRPLALAVVAVLAAVAVPGLVLAVNAAGFSAYRYAPPDPLPAGAGTAGAPRAHDPGKPTAVALVGNHGAHVADTLVPYEILAGTGAFNVYTVAPERRPVPLLGGLDLVPDLDLAELETLSGGAAPAVTVVPEMPDTDPGGDADDAAVTGWLREHAGRGLVLGVCTGARLLAEAGLLDGRPATSHWYRLGRLETDHPGTSWRRGVRYLDDGDVVTTGGLLSSVDGTLRVVERLLGPAAAAEAARRVGWSHHSPGVPAPLPPSGLTPERALVHVLDLGFRSAGTTIGVDLADGVGEIDLAAAVGPWAEVKAARTVTVGERAIRSRHGLTFVPRAGPEAVPGLDRLLVPSSTTVADPSPAVRAARGAGTPIEQLGATPGFAFDGVLQVMDRTMDRATARWAAVVLEYPPEDLRVSGPAWPWGPTAAALALGLGGAAAAVGPLLLVRRVAPGRRDYAAERVPTTR